MHVTAIIVAAGKGVRLRSKISKPLVRINSRPLIVYSLDTLSRHPYVKDIVVVASRTNIKGIRDKIRQYRIGKVRKVILGGVLRRDSVARGLKAADGSAKLVLIHDGGRPFVSKETVTSLIKAAKDFGAAIAGVPVKATIKRVRGRYAKVKRVEKTIDRKGLWEIQTPQVFRKDLIMKAYGRFGNIDATDDAMLVEKLGAEVRVVMGTYENIKITTPGDLVLARALAR